MANIKIDEMCLVSHNLLHNSESFFNELSEDEMQSIEGGWYYDYWYYDYWYYEDYYWYY